MFSIICLLVSPLSPPVRQRTVSPGFLDLISFISAPARLELWLATATVKPGSSA